MTQKQSWITDAITETIDEVMKLLDEVLSEDFSEGILETKLDQAEMGQMFEEVAKTVDLSMYTQAHDQFIEQFGQEEYDKQARLYSERQEVE